MAHAIFLRAVNVGGTGVTSVAALAKKLDLVNIGAAGTFVSRDGRSEAALRKAIAAELSFQTPIMIVRGDLVTALLKDAPLAKATGKPFVAVLEATPKRRPAFPIEDGKGSRLHEVDGRFALAVVLPDAKPGTTVTGLVEKALGVAATVRGWPTMERVGKALEADP